MKFLIYILPLELLSRFFGYFSRISFYPPLQKLLIKYYIKTYKVNCQEAGKPIEEYKSLSDFFVRSLKTKLRPLAMPKDKNLVSSPVDATLSVYGNIKNNTLIQAKKYFYTIEELLQDHLLAAKFLNGTYLVFYLSPSDCHRIFSPINAKVLLTAHIRGKLFPVNEWAVNKINKLFVRNERIVTLLETPSKKKCAVVMIGATNVGSIHLHYDKSMISNTWNRNSKTNTYTNPIPLKRGEELGYFAMGSTVILLFENKLFKAKTKLETGAPIQYGEKIGTL